MHWGNSSIEASSPSGNKTQEVFLRIVQTHGDFKRTPMNGTHDSLNFNRFSFFVYTSSLLTSSSSISSSRRALPLTCEKEILFRVCCSPSLTGRTEEAKSTVSAIRIPVLIMLMITTINAAQTAKKLGLKKHCISKIQVNNSCITWRIKGIAVAHSILSSQRGNKYDDPHGYEKHQ